MRRRVRLNGRRVRARCFHRPRRNTSRRRFHRAQEHFASTLIRERLLGLARQWDYGRGPRAVLACPPGERHDIALICFGLALGAAGWRILFLGPDTPIDTLTGVSQALDADVVVLAATTPARCSDSFWFNCGSPRLSAKPTRISVR